MTSSYELPKNKTEISLMDLESLHKLPKIVCWRGSLELSVYPEICEIGYVVNDFSYSRLPWIRLEIGLEFPGEGNGVSALLRQGEREKIERLYKTKNLSSLVGRQIVGWFDSDLMTAHLEAISPLE